jgi:hypothetical protein
MECVGNQLNSDRAGYFITKKMRLLAFLPLTCAGHGKIFHFHP